MMTPARSTQNRLLYLIPSVRDLIFIFLFWSVLAGPLANRPLADTDIGWHIRTGELILRTGELPRTDPFSSTMQGRSWYAWEWLYDVLLGLLHRACGLNGVVWLCAGMIAFIFAFLLWQLLNRGTGLLLAVLLMLLAEATSAVHLLARPHITSWFFTLAWFVSLEKWDRWDRSAQGKMPNWIPWLFPLSMLLWVNLHAGWIFGMALLAIYCLGTLIESFRECDDLRRIRATQRACAMALTWIGSAVATLINPFGWRLHAHIYGYLSNKYLIDRIDEFRSPNFHGWAERAFTIVLMLLLVALATNKSHEHRYRLKPSHLLVALLCVYSGFFSTRNLPIASMLLVLIAGPMLSHSLRSIADKPGAGPYLRTVVKKWMGSSERLTAAELGLAGHLWPLAAVLFGLIIALHGGWLGKTRVLHAGFDPKKVPADAVDFIQTHADENNDAIFSSDSWGGYLIYRLYPAQKVVIDDRHDLYGSERVQEYLIFMQGETGWREVLRKWNLKLVLVPAGSTSANLLRELPAEWRVLHEDQVAIVFGRR